MPLNKHITEAVIRFFYCKGGCSLCLTLNIVFPAVQLRIWGLHLNTVAECF